MNNGMKKFTSMGLAAALAIMAALAGWPAQGAQAAAQTAGPALTLSLAAGTEAAGPLKPNDVDGDTEISMRDVMLIYLYFRGKIDFTEEQKAAADITGSGSVTMQDVMLVYQYFRGKISDLGRPEPTTLAFLSRSYSAAIPGSATVKAMVYDQRGGEMRDEAVAYALKGAYPGVSLDGATGQVTVGVAAGPGTVAVTASSGKLTATAEIELKPELPPPSLAIAAVAGRDYFVEVNAENMASFPGAAYTLSYDPAVFDVADLRATALTGINIVKAGGGEITFTVSKTIPPGTAWSGCLNVFRFRAKATAATEMKLLQP
jgi:hypothetical protein